MEVAEKPGSSQKPGFWGALGEPMRTVTVELGGRTYPIYIGFGILEHFGECYLGHQLGRRTAVVHSDALPCQYLDWVRDSLENAGCEVLSVAIPDGEAAKTLDTADRIFERLIRARLDRRSTIVALGGGVVGDTAGFVAATFLRGVGLVQVPTTLVAQTDSSVGGKVAVNHRLGKNLIGAFHQPGFVFIDTSVLCTLPPREVAAGLAEVVKHAVILDEPLFAFLEEHVEEIATLRTTPEALDEVIERNCRIKAGVVRQDETEQGVRAILNYGHTVGHALEALTEYARYKHGEAVLLGMTAAAHIARIKGMLSQEALERHNRLIQCVGPIPPPSDLRTDRIIDKMRSDKKAIEGKIRFVLPEAIGKVVLRDDVTEEEMSQGIQAMCGVG
jgi:3-dehydroquinate synthase